MLVELGINITFQIFFYQQYRLSRDYVSLELTSSATTSSEWLNV